MLKVHPIKRRHKGKITQEWKNYLQSLINEFIEENNLSLELKERHNLNEFLKQNPSKFVELSIKIHGDHYNYNKVNFTGFNCIIDLICPNHGEFKVRAGDHIYIAAGCKYCNCDYDEYTAIDKETFVKLAVQIHRDLYDYSKFEFKAMNKKGIVICKRCGLEFEVRPSDHIRGKHTGCPHCNGIVGAHKRKNIITTEEFIRRAKLIPGNAEKYDYSETEYINWNTKVKIFCRECQEYFWQRPGAHLEGAQHSKCKVKSKAEFYLEEMLKQLDIKYFSQQIFPECKDKKELPFDFYLPDYNLCIECQGLQHYIPVKRWGGEEHLKYVQHHDQIKRDFCKTKNIQLLEIKVTSYKPTLIKILKESLRNVGINVLG